MSVYETKPFDARPQIEAILSDPLLLPFEFKKWLVGYLEQNQPGFSIRQLLGYSTLFTSAPGYTYSYTEFIANVTVTATTEATANTVVTAPALTLDGLTAIRVEFFSPAVLPDNAAVGRIIRIVLYDGSTSIGYWADVLTPAASTMEVPVLLARKLTPSAASHTYSVRAYVNAGTGTVAANTGGAAAYMPGYIQITKV